MNDRLSTMQIGLLTAYASAMAAGQLLFKLAAIHSRPSRSVWETLGLLLFNGYFLLAITFYAVLTVAWVWILTFTPLSRAYPFVALAFALTPALAAVLFSEPISLRLVVGTGVILIGLLMIAG